MRSLFLDPATRSLCERWAQTTEASTHHQHQHNTDEKGRLDELVEDHGVRILIEPAAMMHVLGTKMDYVEDQLK